MVAIIANFVWFKDTSHVERTEFAIRELFKQIVNIMKSLGLYNDCRLRNSYKIAICT